jgi:hypothetical protein
VASRRSKAAAGIYAALGVDKHHDSGSNSITGLSTSVRDVVSLSPAGVSRLRRPQKS